MPTKKNFLGGQQNYDPKNGEYTSSLVNAKGQVETDADKDGVSHESKKEKMESLKSKQYEARKNYNKTGDESFIKESEKYEKEMDSLRDDMTSHKDEYTGREPGGVKGDFDRAGFASEVVDDKTLKVYGMNGNEYTIKENENLGFDVYLGDKKIIDDVNANRENVSTKLLQWEQSNTNNPMSGMNAHDFDRKEQDFDDPKQADHYKAEEKDFSTEPHKQKLSKGQKVVIKDKNGNDMEAYIGGFYYNQKLQDEDTFGTSSNALVDDFRGIQLVDKDGKEVGNINANQIERFAEETKEYKPFEGKHNYLVNRMYNSDYDTPEEVYKDAQKWELSDKEKYGLDEEVKKVFSLNDEEIKAIKSGSNGSPKPSYTPTTKIEKDVDKWVEENWHSLDKDMPLGFMVDEIPVHAPYPVVMDALTKSVKSRAGKVEEKK